LQHDFDVQEIALMETEIEMQTAMEIKEIDALKKRSIRVIEAENQKHLAELRSKAKAT